MGGSEEENSEGKSVRVTPGRDPDPIPGAYTVKSPENPSGVLRGSAHRAKGQSVVSRQAESTGGVVATAPLLGGGLQPAWRGDKNG